jgi:DNA repair exonuclease SbcCD ATPase subunit
MEFTPTLAVLPSKWDYHLCSGGERKRIDMAIMFALYDLYIHMYGQQCNIMVLDEVDGRLDADGIQAFINIIYNDFSGSNADSRPKPGSILIISHRSEMLDAFPSKILVKKSQGFSFIESVI